jgi:hypothetical protein
MVKAVMEHLILAVVEVVVLAHLMAVTAAPAS